MVQHPRLLGRNDRNDRGPDYERLKQDPAQEATPEAGNQSAQENVTFLWNGRPCSGTPLHTGALAGDTKSVTEILNDDPSQLEARFHYHTYHDGQEQEGSGQAIHLAASRGHVHLVRLLMSRGASLDAKVTRGGKEHYDVLHAAVFAEGRANVGGEMVRHLLQARARITANSDGRWPLHIAFQTGSASLIPYLRAASHEQRVLDQVECTGSIKDESEAHPSPLLLGIRTGRMTELQLARVAAHTPQSLHIFIHHEPRCIPHFLRQILDREEVTAARLARHLSGDDLAKVVLESPEAACALIDSATADPACEGTGWHPLPSRVSLAPRSFLEEVRYLLNPPRQIMAFYETDTDWKYDVARFEYPAWHQELLDAAKGRPVRDASVKVCHVPDLICAPFFAALAEASEGEKLDVFKNRVVLGAIEYTWWKGACRVDLLQVWLSLWCLALLIVEAWMVDWTDSGMAPLDEDVARRLRAHAGHQGVGPGGWIGSNVTIVSDAPVNDDMHQISVSANFIGAKGVIDFIHELLQFSGLVSIGRWRSYFSCGNAWDLARSILLMRLFYDRKNDAVNVLVIFVCWARLLDVFTSAEKIGCAFLPIRRLVWSLIPASAVTLVGFCAFTHAFQQLLGYRHSFLATFFMSFSTLITTELPTDLNHTTGLQLALTCVAVLFFSNFILNIFIGVIGAEYEKEKDRVKITFQHERAQSCLNFLLRAKQLPTRLCGRGTAVIVTLFAASSAFTLQVFGVLRGRSLPYTRHAFCICQIAMVLMAYQNRHVSFKKQWSGSDGGQPRYYLWLAVPSEPDEKKPEDLERGLTVPSSAHSPLAARTSGERNAW